MSIYCAREFSAIDIQTIRDLIHQDPKLQRSALSRKLCELWGWTKPVRSALVQRHQWHS